MSMPVRRFSDSLSCLLRRILVPLVLAAGLSVPGLSAQTMGVATLGWLEGDMGDKSRTDQVAQLMADLEGAMLDWFFENGYIAFNLPPRVRETPDSDTAALRGGLDAMGRLELINLGSALGEAGAGEGILAEARIGFSPLDNRAFLRSVRLRSLSLSRQGKGLEVSTGARDVPPADSGDVHAWGASIGRTMALMVEAL